MLRSLATVPIPVLIGLRMGFGRVAKVDRVGRLFRCVGLTARDWALYRLRLLSRIRTRYRRNCHGILSSHSSSATSRILLIFLVRTSEAVLNVHILKQNHTNLYSKKR